jgi:hypothetical protein
MTICRKKARRRIKNEDKIMALKYLLILTFISVINFAQTGNLRGKVVDSESKQPLVGVNIIIKNTDFGAATNEAGEYVINKIPVGVYEVSFSYIGYSGRTIPDVVIKSNKIVYLNNEMQPSVIEGKEVTVSSGYFNNTQNSVVSAQSLSFEEIRRNPGAREDVSRMVQNLPGVNPSNDDRNDLLIRGGSPTEVLFVIDDFEVANPNHFGTQGSTGGPISMINNEFVEKYRFLFRRIYICIFKQTFGSDGYPVPRRQSKRNGRKARS